ncbi:hybrid sensor histidine kinase/response regulator transcription factor [Sabulibacter ruber]|uniref:hybrid sensor histidine kinase/response regulator transcription factor n=1 Tax=Sabulibacter ruber TaxID=2811901 RepID=UPI001F61A45A|nr:two-component regulator propeller domain-containing protein [Sabulibacter ruber]
MSRRFFLSIATVLVIVANVTQALANLPDQRRFLHIDVNNGLSHNQVTCFLKDSKGYIWVGTSSGLNRFDGYGVKVFRHNSRTTASLRDNHISKIFEDPEGNIWVATQKGLTVYNPILDKFDRDYAALLKKYTLPAAPVQDIVKDNFGNFWFLQNGQGLTRFNPKTKVSTKVTPIPGKTTTLGSSQINTLAFTSQGDVWVLHADGLLEKLNGKTLKVEARETGLQTQFRQQALGYGMTIDRDDDLWLFSSYESVGAFLYKSASRTFLNFHENAPELRLNSNLVRGVVENEDGTIWLATDHGGVNIVNKKDLSVQFVKNSPEIKNSLSHNSLISIYKDREGIIWLGTYKKGLNYYHKNLFRFQHHQNQLLVKGSLPYADINRFVEDARGNLWIGTNGGGLLYWNRSTGQYTRYQHNPKDPTSISSNVIVSLLLDKDQNLWIGTYLGGLNKFDGQKFTRYKREGQDALSLGNDNVWELFQDSKGRIWMGTMRGGLQQIDPHTGKFKPYHRTAGQAGIEALYVATIAEDTKGRLWVGGDIGVEVLDLATNKLVQFQNDPRNPRSLSSNTVLSILQDSRENIWVGTNEGLNLFNPKTNSFRLFTKENGLADNIILNILEDRNHDLWVSTPNGISKLEISGREAQNVSFVAHNYDESDGLQGKAFNENAAYLTRKGEVLFGGPNGFNLFQPSKLSLNKVAPAIVFTDFQLFNRSLNVGEEVDHRVILTKALSATRQIALKHDQNMFTVEFAALNFFHSEKNKYQYKLEGFDKEWHTTNGNNRRITYTNLDPGQYQLKVRASNNDGVWNKEGINLNIEVEVPFWRSNVAYVLYFLIVFGVLYLIRWVEMQKANVNFALERERREVKHMRELHLMKIKFFTNISHEFRTPLTLILAPLERLLATTQDSGQQRQFQMINRNAKRLLHLVNQLLDFRKLEVEEVAFAPSVGNIIKFIKESVYSFSDLSEKNHVNLSFETSVKELHASFDMDKLGKILFNLLSNAFKFTPENGHIKVEVQCLENDSESQGLHLLEIKVSDTGIGISKEAQEKIFDRFFREDVPDNLVNQGSGIGLAITKEFVKIHGGLIQVRSELGKGSCFTVTLPIKVTGSGINGIEAGELTEEIAPVSKGVEITKRVGPESQEQKLVVLLVEDNADFRTYLKENLGQHFNVVEAKNGKEGWQKALAYQPDLILSDLMMPEMNGIDFCKKIKADARTTHIPFVLLTAQTAEEQKLQGLDIGANDYITKPFNFEMLLSRMSNLITQCQLLQKAYGKKISVQTSEVEIVSLDDKLIQKAIKVVEDNIDCPQFSVELMSRELGMSRVYLYKRIVALTGQTPMEFIRKIRLERAAQLLEKSQLTVAEVAYAVGFNNPRYFSKYFKEQYHMLPSVYAESKQSHSIT